MADPLFVTEHDVREPNLLLRFLRRVATTLDRISGRVARIEAAPPPPSMDTIRTALQATGSHPLYLGNLLGQTAEPQPASVTHFATTPTGLILQRMRDSQLVTVGSTSTGDTLYRVIGGNPNSLRVINPSISIGSVIVVEDDDFTVVDNLDNTKRMQFQNASITAGNTRVMTIPDIDQILAGRNVNNSFTTQQTFTYAGASPIVIAPSSAPAASTLLFSVQNSTGVSVANIDAEGEGIFSYVISTGLAGTAGMDIRGGNSGLARIRLCNEAGTAHWRISQSPTATGGQGNFIIRDFISGTDVMSIRTTDNLVSIARAVTVTAGVLTLSHSTQSLLLSPTASPGSGTKMMEVRTSTGGSVFSVTSTGDIACSGSITATSSVAAASASFTGSVLTGIVNADYTGGFSGIPVIQAKNAGASVFEVNNDGDVFVTGSADIDGIISMDSSCSIRNGAGSPEGAVSAVVGSLYLCTNGTTGAVLYVKELGSGSTGWRAI